MTQKHKNITFTFLIFCAAVFHVLVHDHWLATAKLCLESIAAVFSVTSPLWNVLWCVSVAASLISVAILLWKYTWDLSPLLDRLRDGLSILFLVWLWTGSNAGNMLSQWEGMFGPGNWAAFSIFAGDWIIFGSVFIAANRFGRKCAQKWQLMDIEDAAVGFMLIAILATTTAFLDFKAIQNFLTSPVFEELYNKPVPPPEGWIIQSFDEGYVWIAPNREISVWYPSREKALESAVLYSQLEDLSKVNNAPPPGAEILRKGDEYFVKRRVEVRNTKITPMAFKDKETALDFAWRAHYSQLENEHKKARTVGSIR